MKQALLPIKSDGSNYYLDASVSRNIGEELSGQYAFSDPFPHIVIDELLPQEIIRFLCDNFPKDKIAEDINYDGQYFEHNKRQVLPNESTSKALGLFQFFNSSPFLQFLEGLSGIQGLIPDPYFVGGGFHEIKKGGKLGIHADFRIQNNLHLIRRLNVLIYLNEYWMSEFGGSLELWDKKMTKKIKSIEPIFNRCVIFNTDSDSYHGHPEPLTVPGEITRKSIALYYYTASKSVYDEVPNQGTQFQGRNNYEDFKVRAFNISKYTLPHLISDFTPPIIFRNIKKLKRYFLLK